ncbi:hypothetical protein BDZ89DRAFT_1007296 [Hymenopellis radicata]|nr:hypothetical protein BDZ89DRAFT_1007296 [Hymenopellis radicata]
METERQISLIVYHSPLFPAHWSLYIPSAADSGIGKIVHATGDARNGFVHELKRGYRPADDERAYSIIPIALVSSSHVVDVHSNSGLVVHTAPDEDLLMLAVDDVERVLLSVPAPSKSLNSVDGSGIYGKKVVIKNCQTWIREAVEALIQMNIAPSESLTVLDEAPIN